MYYLIKKGSEKIPEMVGKIENKNLNTTNPFKGIYEGLINKNNLSTLYLGGL